MDEAGAGLIKQAEEDKELDISAVSKYKTVLFFWCGDGYTWTAIPNWGGGTYKGEPIKDWPHQKNSKRKTFKTLAGAKRNFIKAL